MIQEIELKGISNSPSDHECADGELGSCLNLINEDGALKPIYSTAGDTSLKLDETITSGDNAGVYKRTIRFVHKVTHGDEIHIHYIAYVYTEDLDDKENNGYLWQWYEPTTGEWQDISIVNKDFNSVNAIGNILCFVGEDNIIYGYWQKDYYKLFEKDSFKYDLKIKRIYDDVLPPNSYYGFLAHANMGDEFWNNVLWYSTSAKDEEEKRIITGINTNQLRNVFSALDANVNQALTNLGKEYFKYIILGVVAIKLYDGNYINVSNVFMIAPPYIDNIFEFNKQARSFSMTCAQYRVMLNLNINMYELSDLVQCVDIYLTLGDTFLDFDKKAYISNYDKFNISALSGQDLNKAAEDKVFYKSLSLKEKDLEHGFFLKRPTGVEESLSLADFKRINFGGTSSFVYNNRLHIANINTGNIDFIKYIANFEYYAATKSKYGWEDEILGSLPDLPIKDGLYSNNSRNVNAIIVFNTQTKRYYFAGSIPYPIWPFFSVPINDADSADIYLINFNKYWHKKIALYRSSNWGASFYIHTDRDGKMSPLQINDVSWHTKVESGSIKEYLGASPNGEFEEITAQEYLYQWNLWKEESTTKKYPNLIRVSEAENPLVFPAANSVQVGSSVVKSLASNTHTISEGQFGTAPLYAFTDEGVWALITTGEGTYEARQPVNRDIVSNPDGIISTDDAVLYPTKRGIMLIQGTSSECITEALRGNPFRFTDLFRKDFAKKVLDINGIPDTAVDPIDFDKFLENANMTFDYKDQRLILYNNEVDYAYVFSFKSKMWGAMECDFKYNVNVYPDSYVVTKDGNIKNIHNDEPTDDTRYLVCTRPLTFGSPEHFKTMLTTIVRGYFRNKPGKCGIVLYASNDLYNWMPIATSVDKYLRGIAGSPYKYFRVALTGSLSVEESISGFSSDIQERWQNKLR